MSHFTEVKTEIKNSNNLKAALKQLGVQFEHDKEGVKVMGFVGDSITCEYSIKTGTKYDIGMRLTDEGSYEFVADWDMLKHSQFNSDDFRNKISQKYSFVTVKEQLAEQGYEISEEDVNEDGEIQMVVSKW